jgi:chitinase
MSRSIISVAAAAVAAIASTASATYTQGGNQNVAMYWGQGYDQAPLSSACMDPAVDVVNLAFINQFPAKRGDYPGSNFGMAQCYLRPYS